MRDTKAFRRARQLDRLRDNLGLNAEDAETLFRAERVLRRWAELECGDGNDWGSWAIERDENGEGPPYMVHHRYGHGHFKDYTTRTRIADRERGALKRIAALCAARGLYFWHQSDPRGCALYVSREPLADNDYTRGTAMCREG
jgi:hypothetical protein